MRSAVMAMASATRYMNAATLAATMDRFERMTDRLSVRQAYTTEALAHGPDADHGQVDVLMARIVDRAGLDVRNGMPPLIGLQDACPPTGTVETVEWSPGLDEKLAKLRNDLNRWNCQWSSRKTKKAMLFCWMRPDLRFLRLQFQTEIDAFTVKI